MKSLVTHSVIFILLLTAGIFPVSGQKVEKSINKTFKANQATQLNIDSKFSEVNVMVGEEDEVRVDIDIWVESNNKARAEELLSQLGGEANISGNIITVRSLLPERLNNNRNTKFGIEFTIYAPEYISMNLTNKYGSAFVEEITGQVNISVSYGNLKIGELGRGKEKPLNHIDLAYSSASIEEAGWIKLDLAYSKARVEEATAIMAITKYSVMTLEEGSSMVIESKYDSYSIGEINNFMAEMKYGNVKIEELSKKLEIDSKYTSVKAGEIGSDFELIRIDNSRGNFKLGISESASFSLEGTAESGDVGLYGMTGISKKVDGNEKYFKGSHGDNPQGRIEFSIDGGNLKIVLE